MTVGHSNSGDDRGGRPRSAAALSRSWSESRSCFCDWWLVIGDCDSAGDDSKTRAKQRGIALTSVEQFVFLCTYVDI